MIIPSFLSSQEEYNSYMSCLSSAKVGDKIQFNFSGDNSFNEAYIIYIEPLLTNSNIVNYFVIVGRNDLSLKYNGFWSTPYFGNKVYITGAKKINKNIKLSGLKTLNLFTNNTKVIKIIKHKPEKTNGQKKEKAQESKSKKSIRAVRKNAKRARPNKT